MIRAAISCTAIFDWSVIRSLRPLDCFYDQLQRLCGIVSADTAMIFSSAAIIVPPHSPA
jgi:hypothetical protein